MTCSRSWQIEAIRDGRLTGKDLVSVLRHRERCADCARENLVLAHLGRGLEQLPLLPRDSMTTHRERQQLMAALNDSILAPPRAKVGWRLPGGLIAILALACVGFGVMRKTPDLSRLAANPRSIVEVHAQPGSNWREHVDASTDRIDLTDGIASFRVHPHQRRRVLVRLPDGEVEDVGTVFEVNVLDHQTRSIAVQEGRVVVRLHAIPEFALSAGQAWRRPDSAASAAPGDSAVSATSPGIVHAPRPRARKGPATISALVAATPSKPENHDLSDGGQTNGSKDEDRAYLNIVTLLNQRRYAAAQSAAKEYLLQFPNGFRRVEVLNVVASSANTGRNGD